MSAVWNVLSSLRRVSWAPVALDLRDEFTGAGAFGGIRLSLDRQSGPDWIETDIEPTRNAGGMFLYTGIGRAMDPAAAPSFRVRVRIEADYYRPAFQATDDAIEFEVPTYNDSVAPAFFPILPEVVLMLPSAAYPFGGHVRRIHGRVLDLAGRPLADAIVEADAVERVITGPAGDFTLPLRWQAPNANVNVVVQHPRSGGTAGRIFTLPGDLTGNHDITVT
ncbi:MAG TPA: hypothetical protein ENJ79_02760 [Gammaproteobacteria bacterium]|nr:hypothetical protein [Gammaproteobacteria bacterium]